MKSPWNVTREEEADALRLDQARGAVAEAEAQLKAHLLTCPECMIIIEDYGGRSDLISPEEMCSEGLSLSELLDEAQTALKAELQFI